MPLAHEPPIQVTGGDGHDTIPGGLVADVLRGDVGDGELHGRRSSNPGDVSAEEDSTCVYLGGRARNAKDYNSRS